jgi:polygalacturonase
MILFSPDLEEYPLIETYWEGQEEVRRMSPLSGFDLENIAITGLGVFDGNGDAWRKVKRFKLTPNQWSQLLKSGGVVDKKDVWWPSEAAMNGEKTVERLKAENAPVEAYEQVGRYARPVLLSFVKCKGILLDGPTFQNSAAWNLHPLMCEDLIIRNITVRNPWFSANGDGLDQESCKNAVIYNCSFDVGDDAICIKSGRNAYGRERGIPTENVIIADNVVYHGHGGVVVGSEMSGGVRNIDVRRQTFIGTDVGLRFKSTRGRGGVVENIFIKDIQMTNIPAEAIRFNLFYQSKSPLPESEEDMGKALFGMPSAEPVTEETPQFKNITMENIICRGAGRAIMLQGLPEMTLKNVHLKNVDMTATKGVVCVDAEGIQMENVTLSVAKGPGFILINSYNIDASGLELIQDQPKVLINGERTSDIKLTEALEAVATIGKEVGSLN